MQHVGVLTDVPSKKYPLLISQTDPAVASKVSDFVGQVSSGSADVTMKKILLQDTLQLKDDVDFIKLHQDSFAVSLLATGVAFEHGATFALGLLVAFMLTVITQIIKDKERFQIRDLVERIELQKIKIKLQVQAQAKFDLRQKMNTDQEKQEAPMAAELVNDAY